jgi:hypothetical protein
MLSNVDPIVDVFAPMSMTNVDECCRMLSNVDENIEEDAVVSVDENAEKDVDGNINEDDATDVYGNIGSDSDQNISL